MYRLEHNGTISHFQSAYRRGRSTLDPLMHLISDVHLGFETKPFLQTIVTTLYLTSAFNCVDHLKLLDLFHQLHTSCLHLILQSLPIKLHLPCLISQCYQSLVQRILWHSPRNSFISSPLYYLYGRYALNYLTYCNYIGNSSHHVC